MIDLKGYHIFPLEGAFILSNGKNRFFILNQKGKFIWDRLSIGEKEDKIEKEYKDKFALSENNAKKELNLFLKELLASKEEKKEEKKEKEPLKTYIPYISKTYKIFGKNILLNIQLKELENLIEPVFSEWAHKGLSSFDIVMDFLKEDDNYKFYINKKEVVKSESFPYLRGVALFEITNSLFPDREWISVLHGSILKKKKDTILIMGESGKGKSTLTAYLTSQGFCFLSDDMILLDKEKMITKTPFAISLKEKSWDILNSYIPSLKALPFYKLSKGKIKYFLPLKDDNYLSKERPTALFLCEYSENKRPAISLLSSPDAFIHIINAGAWVLHTYNELKTFIDWIRDIPSYMLTYSSLNEAKGLIDEVLN